MKTIKTISAFTAAICLIASCEYQEIDDVSNEVELTQVTISASFGVDKTKAAYTEQDTEDGHTLSPVLELGDTVIGLDDENNSYILTVDSVDAGVAILTGETPASCNLHLIYLPGAKVEDMSEGQLQVDYQSQSGDNTIPAAMLADGVVEKASGEFVFHNAGAIIGVSEVKGVPKNAVINKVTIEGKNMSSASVTLEDSALKLTAVEKNNDAISSGEISTTVTDDNGTLSRSVFIAVPAGAIVSEVKLTVSGDSENCYSYSLPTSAKLSANQFAFLDGKTFGGPYPAVVEYVEIAGLKWAKENLAISESGKQKFPKYYYEENVYKSDPGEYTIGDYFQNAVYEGFCGELSDTDKGLLIYQSFDFSNIDDAFTGGETDSIVFKSELSFKDENAPYNNGFEYVKYTNPGENLDSKDDVANRILGGRWRLPTVDEFNSLCENTYWKYDEVDHGYYLYTPQKDDAGKMNEDGTGSYSKEDALLFFPCTGMAFETFIMGIGLMGGIQLNGYQNFDLAGYEMLELVSETLGAPSGVCSMLGAFCIPVFGFPAVHAAVTNPVGRYAGFPVRPVSD